MRVTDPTGKSRRGFEPSLLPRAAAWLACFIAGALITWIALRGGGASCAIASGRSGGALGGTTAGTAALLGGNATNWDQLLSAISAAGVQLNHTQELLLRRLRLELHVDSAEFKQRVADLHARASAAGDDARGVLIVAGGRDMLLNAYITLRVLREILGCTLPVEVVYFGEVEHDAAAAQLLLDYAAASKAKGDVRLVDGADAAGGPSSSSTSLTAHHRRVPIESYASKVYALCYVTRFRHVLMLDADAMPLIDPSPLFDAPSYRAAGSTFWPDFWHNAWVKPALYEMFGMDVPWDKDPQHRLTDSGQVLLDRARHADVLEYLWFLNSHREVVYSHMHGDKDTYKLSFFLAGKLADFYQVRRFARDAMTEAVGHEFPYHHLGMLHSTPPGVSVGGSSSGADGSGDDGADEGLAFFHRTSFNSKFFPDCVTRARDAGAGKEGAARPSARAEGKPGGYCRVAWISVPLTDAQAGRSLKPHMYAFSGDEVDATTWKRCSAAGGKDGAKEVDWERAGAIDACAPLKAAAERVPIPVLPAEGFPRVSGVLEASYRVYEEVAAAMEAKERATVGRRRRRRLLGGA